MKCQAVVAMLIVAAGTGAPGRALGQVQLGTAEVRLGTPKGATLDALRLEFRVDSLANRDQWLLLTRAGPPFVPVGTVAFRAGRVALITRTWTPGPSEPSQADLMRAVTGALQTLLVDRQARCSVVDRSNRGPGFDLTSLEIACGERRVSLGLTRADGQVTVSVTELVGSDPR